MSTEAPDQVRLCDLTDSEYDALKVVAESEDLDPTDYVVRRIAGVCWTHSDNNEHNLTHPPVKPDPTVATEVWEPNPERPGYSRKVRTKTVDEVFAELVAIVGEYPDGCNEYFSVYAGCRHTDWPAGRMVVFVVTGGSEGHYTHVEVLDDERRHHPVILGKTFDGFDNAWAFAKRLARILEV